jgi:Nitrogen permease regulator 2
MRCIHLTGLLKHTFINHIAHQSLYVMQNESEFLFLESTKPQIQNVLRNLFEDLTEKGETFINLDESNILTAKIYRAPQEPIEIFEYNVPILRYDKISQINIPWDISLNYLLGRIDGISHIRKIASRKPIVDIECVKRCLRTLMFYDCVVISDVVQFTNVYQLQKNVQPLICDISILQRIQSFCCVKQQEPPDLGNIVRFLLKFRPGKQLSQVLVSAGVELLYGIDVRRLIAIAQDFNIISRLHEYPVYILRQEQEKSGTTSTPLQLQQTESSADIQRLLHSGSARLQPPTTARVTSKDLNPTSNINAIKTRNLLRRSVTSVEQSVLNASSEIGSTDLSYVLCSLKGSVCLDAVCCALEIAPSEILDSSKYYIVYK